MKKTKLTAISSICGAISVSILYLGSLAGDLDLTFAALASFVTVFAVIELSGPYPVLIYAVTSVISLLIIPQKSAALLYVLFAGFYPILKARFERRGKKRAWLFKVAVLNISLTAIILALRFVTGLSEDVYAAWYFPLLYIFANITFIIYDIALTKIITRYVIKISPKLRKFLK